MWSRCRHDDSVPRSLAAGAPISSIHEALAERRAPRHGAGEAICRCILADEPENLPALRLLGALLLEAGRPGEAEFVLRQCLARDGSAADTLHNLGLARAATGDFREAAYLFARTARQQPDYVSACYNLALALQADGDADRAATVYERVIALQPDHARAWNNLGILHHGRNELEAACRCYRRALQADPAIETTRANLASALRALGDAAAAAALFDDALRRDPQDPLAHDILAQTDYLAGDMERATGKLCVALHALITRGGWLTHAAAGSRAIPLIDSESYREALVAVLELTSTAGFEVCLLCGTLLGAIRDGDIIRHDKDIDFGIDSSVTPAMLDAVLSKDDRFRRMTSLADETVLPWYASKNIALDFFRLFREDDSLWYGLVWHGHLVRYRHRNFHLRDFTFLGVATRIPADSERYLVEAYGEGWRTPDPYFAAWASPNIEGGFPPVCRCLAYANIFKAAWTGDAARARRSCEQALALDAGDTRVAALRDILTTHAARLTMPQGSFLPAAGDPFGAPT